MAKFRPKKGVTPPHLRAYLFKKSGRTETMPRKSRRASRRAPRFSFRARRAPRRFGGGNGDTMRKSVIAAFYAGFLRPMVAKLAQPVTDKLPFGNLNDEAALGGAAFLASKQSGMVGEVGRIAIVVEAASAGSTLSSGFSGGTSAPASGNLRPSIG